MNPTKRKLIIFAVVSQASVAVIGMSVIYWSVYLR